MAFGAVTMALGEKIAGLMGNDDGWISTVRDAAERAGERVWHLPLPADYRRNLDSEVADLRNISSGGGAGTLTAVGLELGLAEADGFALAGLVGPDVVLEPLPPAEHPAISNAAPPTRATANSGRTAA